MSNSRSCPVCRLQSRLPRYVLAVDKVIAMMMHTMSWDEQAAFRQRWDIALGHPAPAAAEGAAAAGGAAGAGGAAAAGGAAGAGALLGALSADDLRFIARTAVDAAMQDLRPFFQYAVNMTTNTPSKCRKCSQRIGPYSLRIRYCPKATSTRPGHFHFECFLAIRTPDIRALGIGDIHRLPHIEQARVRLNL